MLGESAFNRSGILKIQRYYIWLDNLPIAQITDSYKNDGSLKNTEIFYLHTDHLNAPRVATDENKTLVWNWASDAFGVGKVDRDPDGDGIKHNVHLRFPGQYHDGETGLYYNYFRDYDRTTGRYVQSDPIGLNGGINTYAYVGGNPMLWIDSMGLASITGTGTIHIPGFISSLLGSEFPISGIHGGIAASFPTPWEPDVPWDIGLVGGLDIPVFSAGLGKASFDIGLNKGSLCDLVGGSYEISAVIGKHSGALSFSEDGELTGAKYGRGVTPGRVIKTIATLVDNMRPGNFRDITKKFINNNFSFVYQKSGVVSYQGN